ncbi:MAG: hypothetical protein APF84_15875 [Gracilibacter sp. BRH_c7a]|nr:MAG: hypothetical protein APF84_15875 [Gracilibacter sp. BRH_c7a]
MEYSLILSLQQRKINLFRGGRLIKSYPVAIGKASTPTPKGTFSIESKTPNPGGLYGNMWLGLSKPRYGIHGTNDPQSIGKMISKGCIRMYNEDVLELSRIIPIGTTITIR